MQSLPPFLPINFLFQIGTPCLREAASAKAGELRHAPRGVHGSPESDMVQGAIRIPHSEI
jgi:hypothetical protein